VTTFCGRRGRRVRPHRRICLKRATDGCNRELRSHDKLNSLVRFPDYDRTHGSEPWQTST
jgi:hypothetical protein